MVKSVYHPLIKSETFQGKKDPGSQSLSCFCYLTVIRLSQAKVKLPPVTLKIDNVKKCYLKPQCTFSFQTSFDKHESMTLPLRRKEFWAFYDFLFYYAISLLYACCHLHGMWQAL